MINIQLKKKINKKTIFIFSKLLFLIQLFDDYLDIDKDISENNNTYFTSKNISLPFDDRIKKIITSIFIFISELNDRNKQLNNIFYYSIKNMCLCAFYLHIDKFSENLANNLNEKNKITFAPT